MSCEKEVMMFTKEVMMFTVEKRLGVYCVLLNGVVFARYYSESFAIENADYLNNLPVE